MITITSVIIRIDQLPTESCIIGPIDRLKTTSLIDGGRRAARIENIGILWINNDLGQPEIRVGIDGKDRPATPVVGGFEDSHTGQSHVAYDPSANQLGCEMRSRKFASLLATLRPPKVHGDPEGDLLVVGWGSTLGSIEEAVDRAREAGHRVSSLHLRFLCPLEPGLDEIFDRFDRVMTVELNYSDQPAPDGSARPSHLALHLRSQLRRDVDYWSITPGQPLSPGQIHDVIIERLPAARPAVAVPGSK